MRVVGRWGYVPAAAAAGAFVLSLVLTFGAAQAQDKTYVMKISLPTINDTPHLFAKNYAAAVEKDSGGRIKTEVYPASQLGSIPRQIEGAQFGAIQAVTIPPEFFVGVDDRFEVMAAPGLVDNMEHGQRLAADPAVLKLMLGLGADKGLHGVGLYIAQPSCIISRTPIRHLADFKGKKIRVFASQFQTVAFDRLGATPVAMTLGDVLPALQQGAIDGAIAGIGVFYNMHFNDAAKYVTETNQPAIFIILEVSQKWYELAAQGPAGDRRPRRSFGVACDQRAGAQNVSGAAQRLGRQRRRTDQLAGRRAGADDANARQRRRRRSKSKPGLHDAYAIVSDAAKRTRQPQTQ